MKVDQAIFGERRGGHALRDASGDTRFATEIAPRLDLPDTAPGGVAWSPFISGFAHSDNYVLARTFLDPIAPRAGMVLSHALIVPLPEIVGSTDLRPLFDRLIAEPVQPQSINSFEIDPQTIIPPAPPELVGMAEALTARGTGPVVRLGLEFFEDLVVAMWARFWPALRHTFSFRLSFSPGDLVESSTPKVVCTPLSLATRWRGFRIVDNTSREPTSLSAALLAGRGQATPLMAFADRFGIKLNSFGDLPLLEKAYRLFELEQDTFGHVTAAARLVDKLSPRPSNGIEGKNRLVDRLELQISAADADAILTLRNLEAEGFSSSKRIWESVRRWAELNAFPASQDVAIMNVVADAMTDSGAIAPWRDTIASGFRAAARKGNGLSVGFWRWIQLKPTMLSSLASCIDLNRDLDGAIADKAPIGISDEAARALLRLANERQLPQLHGIAVSEVYPAIEAARAQIMMEGPDPSAHGLTLALRNSSPEELIASAIEVIDPRLVALAGAAAARSPGLLSKVDMGRSAGQAIWAAGLAIDPDTWKGPSDPGAAVGQVLTNVLDGGPADQNLLERIARTPCAALGVFNRRAELWGKLPTHIERLFMEATAKDWTRSALGGHVPFKPEPQLEAEILGSTAFADALKELAAGRITAGLSTIAALPSFPEHRLLSWLQDAFVRAQTLSVSDAEALGRLVLDRRWSRVVDDLVSRLRGREDVRPALRVCASMLDIFTRWLLGLSSLTTSEKWNSLENILAELYPSGPDHHEIWERAGGSNADLPHYGNGRSRWHETLVRMRHGGGRVRIDGLLYEMRREYPMNEQLQFLANDSRIQITLVRKMNTNLQLPEKAAHFPHGRALVIAVANYNEINRLPAAVLNDARNISSALSSPDQCGYELPQVTTLLDNAATLQAIRDALAALASSSRSEDTVVIYFSGHGARLRERGEERSLLLPVDCERKDPSGTSLSEEEFSKALAAIPAGRLLVVLDACHSGGAGSLKEAGFLDLEYGVAEKNLQQLAQGTGRVIMASSRASETSLILPGARNSVFTQHFLEALNGAARTHGDGLIRVFEVFNYVSEKVRRSVPGRQHPIFKASELEDNFPIALYQGGRKTKGLADTSAVPWRQLEEIIADLYPAGPTDDEIWSRAGGDVSRLNLGGTGRTMWFAALRALRQGGGGANISVRSLVATALGDFPHHPELQAVNVS